MMKFLPFAIWALALVGGLAGGVMMKSASSHNPQATTDTKDAARALADAKTAAKTAEKSGAKEEKSKKGDENGKDETISATMGFMKFGRQFIVPVIDGSGVKSLVIMDITIEVPPSETDKAYAAEPKLRDAILSALLKLSDDGAFSGKLLEGDNLDGIRAALLAAARKVISDNAKDVLILGITRHDV
ncbi:MAG: hypothetical protein GC153_13575 [Alphaproteobacteria bacterium]|nr:hypothetical protein [Alphaproteobacteria bacterium]